jgi:hypothetical protein
MSGPVYIRIDRPEEYDDVADELLIEDWIGCLKGGAVSAETGGFDWQQVAASAEPTDEMVQAAWDSLVASAAHPHDFPSWLRVAAALRAALGVAKS